MYFVTARKILCAVGRRHSYAKRERASSLHEYLEDPAPRCLWRPRLALLLLIPAVYYLVTTRFLSQPSTFTQYYVPVNIEEDGPKTLLGKNGSKHQHITIMKKQHEAPITLPDSTTERGSKALLPVCVVNHTQLGRITVNNSIGLATVGPHYPMVKQGGHYTPRDCAARHKVGILVPYRDRSTNLAVFLYNIHPFLINQQLEYRIFVVEQFGRERFNKGRLYNAGFREMQKYGKWQCIVFHDVDLLPLDRRIMYTCPSYPRHMCGTVLQKKLDKKYHSLFGGVTSMTPEHYERVNGYSNMYWGWGGEDNDMFWRIRASGLPVVRYNKSIAEYTALPHVIRNRNKFRFQLLHTAMERSKDEGLSTVEYAVVSVTLRHLYTHVLVNVNPYNDNVTVIMGISHL